MLPLFCRSGCHCLFNPNHCQLPTCAQESVSGATTLLDAVAPKTQQSTGYRGAELRKEGREIKYLSFATEEAK
jgi:hypothetical protein